MLYTENDLEQMGFTKSERDNMPEVMVVKDKDMEEWKQICNAFAKKLNAEIVFVNNTSCGLQFANGEMAKYSVERMAEILENEEKNKNTRSDEER